MPRVLSISTLYPNAARPQFGGFVARSLEALAAGGEWEVTLINPVGLPPIAAGRYAALARAAHAGVENGVEVRRPRFPLVPGLTGRWNPALLARAVLPLARRLHAERPFALVDAQFFYPDGPAAARIAAALGLPLSIKARGGDIHHWGVRRYALQQMRAAGDQAAGLLAVCAALKLDMVAFGLPGEKIAIHYTGVDRARFRPIPRAEARAAVAPLLSDGVRARPALLASVGALIPRKGQRLTLRALAELPEAALLLVGSGPDESALRALARELGIAERVQFLGSLSHDRLPALLTAADAMVLPSASEGLANAWIEALACGAPLVIADCGGAREVVTTPAAGRIVAREPAAIAAGLRDLLGAAPAQAEVARCADRFSWDANAGAMATHYAAIVNSRERKGS